MNAALKIGLGLAGGAVGMVAAGALPKLADEEHAGSANTAGEVLAVASGLSIIAGTAGSTSPGRFFGILGAGAGIAIGANLLGSKLGSAIHDHAGDGAKTLERYFEQSGIGKPLSAPVLDRQGR